MLLRIVLGVLCRGVSLFLLLSLSLFEDASLFFGLPWFLEKRMANFFSPLQRVVFVIGFFCFQTCSFTRFDHTNQLEQEIAAELQRNRWRKGEYKQEG